MNNMSFMNDELLKFAQSRIKHKYSPANIENIDVNISAVTVSTPKAEKQGYDSKGFSSGRERRKKSFVEQAKREIPFPAEIGRG